MSDLSKEAMAVQSHDRAFDAGGVRTFETGATRSPETGKPDYEGYLSPRVIRRFGEYMTKHRVQSDGSVRASDNWQKGLPLDSYVKSAWRHFMDVWSEHRGIKTQEGLEEALCALLFNVQGYLHEHLKGKEGHTFDDGPAPSIGRCRRCGGKLTPSDNYPWECLACGILYPDRDPFKGVSVEL